MPILRHMPLVALLLALVACGDPSTSVGPDTGVPRDTERDPVLDPVATDEGSAGSGDAGDAEDIDAAEVVDDAEVIDAAGLDGADSSDDGSGGPAECEVDEDCADELFCNGDERCSLGRCWASPTPPCADSGPCELASCDELRDECVLAPREDACPVGQLCDPKAGCYTPSECDVDADCDDTLVCNGVERCIAGVCGPGEPIECDDGIACTLDACLEFVGGCQNVPQHDLCLPTEMCLPLLGGCLPRPPCERSATCVDDFFCNGTEFCAEDGLCSPGDVPELDDGLDCTIDVCSEARGAVEHVPVDLRCSDGAFCNGAEVCHPVDGCVAGAPPPLSDGVACTRDVCNEDGDFVEHVPDDAPCEDGLFCNGAEVCDAARGCVAGEPPERSDGIGCTIDTCSEVARAMIHTPDATRCDDGLFCNGAEACDVELGCVAGEAPSLDDGVECTDGRCDEVADRVVHAPNDARCDDGLFCDGAERCDATRGCLAGDPPTIADAFACTVDACDEDADAIVHTPDSSACDDGLFCNGVETCSPTGGCLSGVPPVLSDGVACTRDVCNEELDRVEHIADDSACDNGLFCDGVETCDPVLDCVDGMAPATSDGVTCTTDVCNEVLDRIEHRPDDAACDNGSFCDGAEVCDPLLDCVPGTAPTLDDGVGCTLDVCNDVLDRVEHFPVDGDCDNGLFCDGTERCDAALDCVAGTPPAVSDGIACTDDRCDEALDRVVRTPIDERCDNGRFCDGAEVCSPSAGCVDGPDPTLSDGIGCTEDVCNEVLDRVDHLPVDAACSDGRFCNGAERCDPTLDCVAGLPPVLSDGVDCTLDACNEVEDRVDHLVDDGACDNGLFCDGAERCDVRLDCVAGAAPTLSDGVDCTLDTCDEGLDRIVHIGDDGFCDDGLFCNGAEACKPTTGCDDGPDPVASDGIPCTSDSCNEALDRVEHAPNNALCSNGVFCDGDEVCTVGVGCSDGVDRADGATCAVSPRSICLDGDCGASVCGDGYVDVAVGEECDDGRRDDGDGCDSDCQRESGGSCDYPGTFVLDAAVSYSCSFSIFTVVNFNVSSLSFATPGGSSLVVTGMPTQMTQAPVPAGCGFAPIGTITGDCTEQYGLVGEFTSADTWEGTISLRFTGSTCGFTTCTNQTWTVTGTR